MRWKPTEFPSAVAGQLHFHDGIPQSLHCCKETLNEFVPQSLTCPHHRGHVGHFAAAHEDISQSSVTALQTASVPHNDTHYFYKPGLNLLPE